MNTGKNIKIGKNEFFGNFTKVKFEEGGIFWQCLYKNPQEQEEFIIECIGDEESPNIEIIDWLEQIITKPKALHNHTSLYHHLEWLTKKYKISFFCPGRAKSFGFYPPYTALAFCAIHDAREIAAFLLNKGAKAKSVRAVRRKEIPAGMIKWLKTKGVL